MDIYSVKFTLRFLFAERVDGEESRMLTFAFSSAVASALRRAVFRFEAGISIAVEGAAIQISFTAVDGDSGSCRNYQKCSKSSVCSLVVFETYMFSGTKNDSRNSSTNIRLLVSVVQAIDGTMAGTGCDESGGGTDQRLFNVRMRRVNDGRCTRRWSTFEGLVAQLEMLA